MPRALDDHTQPGAPGDIRAQIDIIVEGRVQCVAVTIAGDQFYSSGCAFFR